MSLLWIFIAAVIIIVLYYILANTAIMQPPPPVPDADFLPLIDDYNSIPNNLWFEGGIKEFDSYLSCKKYRYVVFDSDANVLYDSKPNSFRPAKSLINNVEYTRAVVLTQGTALTRRTINVAELAKDGDKYRVVHISDVICNHQD